MKFNEFTKVVDEGVNDPNIFKAIFMAGSPGSGKSTVAQSLVKHTGLRFIDVDKFEDIYRKAGKEIDYKRFYHLTQKQQTNYIDGRLGLLIDGSARHLGRIIKQKEELEKIGYSTAMIFVNTDLETAQDRVSRRFEVTGRQVPTELVKSRWHEVQSNLGLLQSHFGNNFIIVDNNQPSINLSQVDKKVRQFLNQPIYNKVARQWIDNNSKSN